MDDDDDFLYGGSKIKDKPISISPVPQPVALEKSQSPFNGIVANLEAVAVASESILGELQVEEEEGDDIDLEDASDDDVEIIMEAPNRSLDFRQNPPTRPSGNRTSSSSSKVPQPSLTTEYTPRERGTVTPSKPSSISQSTPSGTSTQLPQSHSTSVPPESHTQFTSFQDGPDPSTLPAVTAPPSHPSINPNLPGTLDGRSILDVDLGAMTEKPWRRPGSDLSDWFNYGFDEISWEAYCYRRRDLGELANVLKTNVINFAGMPEDQLTALPPEIRTMVMTGANAMMSGGGPNPAMMGAGVGMNPMMDMSGMNGMNMGPMAMGMNGEMAMQMQGGGPMMQQDPGPGPGVPVSNVVPDQGVQMGMPDAFGPGGSGPGMMNMGMAGDFSMQTQQPDPNAIAQPIYPVMEQNVNVPVGPSGRGGTPAQYRGRGGNMAPAMRGRGAGFPGRGRGRGGYGGVDGVPPPPVRPASPLPPGVPTGPRNQNKYKDRDGNAPAVDGLDYGGNNKDNGRTPSVEIEERSRKRRSSPGLDDNRGSKRR